MYPLIPEELLASHESPTLCDVEPVPDSETACGELVALLEIVTLPLTAPLVVGSKITLRAAVWLGVSVNPELTPEPLKPVPFQLTPEIVMLELPVFVSETFWDVLVPTATLPNVRLDGETLSEYVAVPPLPASETDSGELGALLTSEIEPETVDVELGLKATLKEADCPAGIVSGAVSPVVLKPVPVTAN